MINKERVRDLIGIIHFTENVSTKIYNFLDEMEIYKIVTEEFAKSKRYSTSIALLTDDKSKLRVVGISLASGELKRGEEAVGFKLKNYQLDLGKSNIYRQVVREGKTIQAKVSDIINELFPRPLAYLISKTMGYEKKNSILTPLKRNREIIGVFAMSSTELADYLIPSVKNLARHISAALELVDEYTKRKRTEEALRKVHSELERRVEERTAELLKSNLLLKQEITEHKQAEKALRESEKCYRILAESAEDFIFIIDRKGYVRYINSSAARILKSSAKKITCKSIEEMIPLKEVKRLKNNLELVFKLGKPTLTVDEITMNNKKFWLETRLAPLIDNGEIKTVMGISRDITEHKQVEESLRKSREQLKAYSEVLEKTVEERTERLSLIVESQKEFIAEIGHELRTPLSVIKAVVEAGLDGNDVLFTTEQLTLVDKKVDQIIRILENLLLVSRLDLGQEQVQKTTFKMRYLLKEVLSDVISEVERNGINSGVKISCSKNIKLVGDREKVYVVLRNLLNNAVVHSDDKPRISLKVERYENSIQIAVKDNNHPVLKEELPKLFEKFYRIQKMKNRSSGLGLGLYISKRLVELMGGKIYAESTKDSNRFVVQLPIPRVS